MTGSTAADDIAPIEARISRALLAKWRDEAAAHAAPPPMTRGWAACVRTDSTLDDEPAVGGHDIPRDTGDFIALAIVRRLGAPIAGPPLGSGVRGLSGQRRSVRQNSAVGSEAAGGRT